MYISFLILKKSCLELFPNMNFNRNNLHFQRKNFHIKKETERGKVEEKLGKIIHCGTFFMNFHESHKNAMYYVQKFFRNEKGEILN